MFVRLEDIVSDLCDLTLCYFDDFSLQLLLALLPVVEPAGVVLGQPVGVAEHETALAFDPQQSNFLVAVEASLPIGLLLLDWLKTQLFDCFLQFYLGRAQGRRGAARQCFDLFFLFQMLTRPGQEQSYLKQEEQRPPKASEAQKIRHSEHLALSFLLASP